MEFNVISWNMEHNADNWAFLAVLMEREKASVALVQEAVCPNGGLPSGLSVYPAIEDENDWKISVPPGFSRRQWASAIVTAPGITMTPHRPKPLAKAEWQELAASHPGQFAAAEITVGNHAITVVSLYGLWEKMRDSGDIYAEATLHRAISDLTPLLQASKPGRIVLAGDLNIWLDHGEGPWMKRYRTVFDRLASYDLRLQGPFRPSDAPPLARCPCGTPASCKHVRTFRYHHNADSTPYQDDYLFATPTLPLVRCKALDDEDVWKHSDHCAVLATFQLEGSPAT